jgi:hypothetical protein
MFGVVEPPRVTFLSGAVARLSPETRIVTSREQNWGSSLQPTLVDSRVAGVPGSGVAVAVCGDAVGSAPEAAADGLGETTSVVAAGETDGLGESEENGMGRIVALGPSSDPHPAAARANTVAMITVARFICPSCSLV